MKNSKIILAVLTSLLFCLLITVPFGVGFGLALFALDLGFAYYQSRKGIKIGSLYTACGVVSAALLFDCTNPTVGGTVPTVYVTNRADIASVTTDGSNYIIKTAITMVATKKFYKAEGRNDGSKGSSVSPSFKTVQLSYGKAYEHLIDMQIFTVDPVTKKQLEAWNLADMVVIVENKFRNATGNCAFEIYGLDGGLQMSEMSRNPNDADTLGAFKLQLKSTENSREAHMPYTFFITDYATSLAAITALL